MKYEHCEGACDYCFYAKRNEERDIIGCTYEPHSDLRDALAANHHYCRYFVCEYMKEHKECKRKK